MQPRDGSAVKAMAFLQVQHRRNRCLCPTADGVGLEILLTDQPSVSQISPVVCAECERRGAGEAARGQTCRRDPAHCAPTGAILEHCWVIDTAHHLAPGAVIFCNPHGMCGLRAVQPYQACGQAGNRHGHPSPRGVIIWNAGMLCHSGAAGQLIAKREAEQKFLTRDIAQLLRQPIKRRQNAAARVPFGRVEPIMAIKRINGHPARKRHARDGGSAPIEHHGQRAAHIQGAIVANNARQFCASATGSNADEIQKAQFALPAHLRWQVVPGELGDEV